ncbi:MAG: group II intron maturase-specific domain-containing protein [Chloroflexota bacterium]|nr:group II intron maturase-specific domain-containing protein [Chloroflexota bacterium]
MKTSTPGPQVDGGERCSAAGDPSASLSTGLAIKRIGVAKKTFDWMDYQLFHKLYRWARFRHPRKTGGWCVSRYWRRRGNRQNFGTAWLVKYADRPIKRHIKSLP